MKIDAFVPVLLAATTVVFYFTGYGYLTGYMRVFGIDIWELGLSVQDVLSHALPPLLEIIWTFGPWQVAAVIVVFAVSLTVAWRKAPWLDEIDLKPVVSDCLFAISFALFTMSVVMMLTCIDFGKKVAEDQAGSLRFISLNPEIEEEIGEFLSGSAYMADARFMYRRIVTTEDQQFVLVTLSNGGDRWVARVKDGGELRSLTYLGFL